MRTLLLALLFTSAFTPGLAQHDFILPAWKAEALGAERGVSEEHMHRVDLNRHCGYVSARPIRS